MAGERRGSSGRRPTPEVALTVAGAAGSVAAAVLAGVVGLLVAGAQPGLAAAVGAAIPAVLVLASLPFLIAGGLLGRPEAIVGASLVAIGFRLVLAFAVVVVVQRTTDLPLEPLALGLAAGLVGAIGGEMRRVTRDPRLLHLDADAVAERQRASRERVEARDRAAAASTLLSEASGPSYLPTGPRRRRR